MAGVGVSAIGPCLPTARRGGDARSGKGILYGVDTRATEEIVELPEERLGKDDVFTLLGHALHEPGGGAQDRVAEAS